MSKLVDLTVNEFIKEVDSDSPAPGGGSVSSLAGTIGCALARMVGHLSFGKKKYEANSEEEKQLFTRAFDDLKAFQDRLEFLVDEDTKSFGVFMSAMKLPKDTDEEKTKRLNAMEETTKTIIKVPFEIAEVSLEALNSLNTIIKFGNKNAITDVGVAALLLNTAVEGAILNVKINLPGLSDEALVNTYKKECETMLAKSSKLKEEYLTIVNSHL